MDTCFEPEKDKAAKGGGCLPFHYAVPQIQRISHALRFLFCFFCFALRVGIVCENTCTVSNNICCMLCRIFQKKTKTKTTTTTTKKKTINILHFLGPVVKN